MNRLLRRTAALTIIAFIIIFVGLIIRAVALGQTLFYDWDEAIYAQVAWEMVKHQNLISTFNGAVWLEKPPLLSFFLGIFFIIFGKSELPIRIGMTTLSAVLLILVYLLSKKIYQNIDKSHSRYNQLAYLLPVFAVIPTMLFLERSTSINVDVLLAISWIGYFLFREKFGAKLMFLLIGTLSKSFLGFYPLLLEVLLIRKKDITAKNIRGGVILITVSLIWHIISLIQYGGTFIQIHIIDHMVKRVTTPIELHFGGKFYYANLLWDNFGILLIFIIIGYALLCISFIKKNNLQNLSSTISKLWNYDTNKLWNYIVLLSPIPFFVFLTLGKSKIYWYLYPLLPLFALILPYVYLKIKHNVLRLSFLFFIILYSAYFFIPQTFLLKPNNSVSDKMKVSECLNKSPIENIAFLVDDDERKIRNVLEAAHLQIDSSFIYGGTPSFVYYSGKHINFYYSIDDFIKNMHDFKIIVLSKSDLSRDNNLKKIIAENYLQNCASNDWLSFQIK